MDLSAKNLDILFFLANNFSLDQSECRETSERQEKKTELCGYILGRQMSNGIWYMSKYCADLVMTANH